MQREAKEYKPNGAKERARRVKQGKAKDDFVNRAGKIGKRRARRPRIGG